LDRSDANSSTEPSDVCAVESPTTCPDPASHYADVAPIFDLRCNGCHTSAGDGPWPLTTYLDIADWQDLVRLDLLGCSMPPPDAGVEITVDEKLAILTWIKCGLPP
jgi:hypothetical protein